MPRLIVVAVLLCHQAVAQVLPLTSQHGFLADGDSQTAGDGVGTNNWVNYFMRRFSGNTNAVLLTNCAISGNTVVNNLANYTNNAQPWTPAIRGASVKVVYMNWSIINDIYRLIYFGEGSIEQIVDAHTELMRLAKRDGCITVGFILPFAHWGGPNYWSFNNARRRVNDILLQRRACDYFIRLDQRFPKWRAEFYADGVHFKTNAHVAISDDVFGELNKPVRTYASSTDIGGGNMELSGTLTINGSSDDVMLRLVRKSNDSSTNLFEILNDYEKSGVIDNDLRWRPDRALIVKSGGAVGVDGGAFLGSDLSGLTTQGGPAGIIASGTELHFVSQGEKNFTLDNMGNLKAVNPTRIQSLTVSGSLISSNAP